MENKTELFELLLIEILLCVHKLFEHEILQEICGNVFINGSGVYREGLRGLYTGIQKLLHKIVNGSHYLQTEGGNEVIVL